MLKGKAKLPVVSWNAVHHQSCRKRWLKGLKPKYSDSMFSPASMLAQFNGSFKRVIPWVFILRNTIFLSKFTFYFQEANEFLGAPVSASLGAFLLEVFKASGCSLPLWTLFPSLPMGRRSHRNVLSSLPHLMKVSAQTSLHSGILPGNSYIPRLSFIPPDLALYPLYFEQEHDIHGALPHHHPGSLKTSFLHLHHWEQGLACIGSSILIV